VVPQQDPLKKRIKKWTVELITEYGKEIHEDKYDYSLVRPEHVINRDSNIPVKCKKCENIWYPPIHSHIRGKTGCRNCSGKIPWTLERFVERSKQIHEEKYDYSMVTNEHIHGKDSKVPIKCKKCHYMWTQTIHSHTYHKQGCPNCVKKAPVTYETFIQRCIEKHGSKYDYSQVTKDHIRNNKSKIPVKCTVCNNTWYPRIDQHMNGGHRCVTCFGNLPWTLETFVQRAKEIHKDMYDYSLIASYHVNGYKSKIPVRCNKCKGVWKPCINDHINKTSGCPRCNFSKGEIACANILEKLGIVYEPQFFIDTLPNRRYDFMFEYNNVRYILEFDGGQHFSFTNFFHIDERQFLDKQEVDVIKTIHAMSNGFHVIRIAYIDIAYINEHIVCGINRKNSLYVSNPLMYQYILNRM